eukprot:9947376-Prorocentrum_lima.AAC.1
MSISRDCGMKDQQDGSTETKSTKYCMTEREAGAAELLRIQVFSENVCFLSPSHDEDLRNGGGVVRRS